MRSHTRALETDDLVYQAASVQGRYQQFAGCALQRAFDSIKENTKASQLLASARKPSAPIQLVHVVLNVGFASLPAEATRQALSRYS